MRILIWLFMLITLLSCDGRNNKVNDSDKVSLRGVLLGTNSAKQGVGALTTPTIGNCTAVEIGERCLLTARHCAGINQKYTQGVNLSPPLPEYVMTLRAKSRDSAPLGTTTGNSANIESDIAVIWTGDKYCEAMSQSFCRPYAQAQWNPQPLGFWTETQYSQAQNQPGALDHEMYGYGMRTATDTTAPRQRKGDILLGYFPPGSFYGQVLGFKPNTTNAACPGDSGGPIYNKSGEVVAIVSSGVACDPAITSANPSTFGTGLGGGGDETVNNVTIHHESNYEWVQRMKNKFCRPALSVLTDVFLSSYGNSTPNRAIGKVLSRERDTAGKPYIDCGGAIGNCQRMFDPIDDNLPRTITLTASNTVTGFTFDHWERTMMAPCPCDGSPITSCTLSAGGSSPMYGSAMGAETQGCAAVYKSNPIPGISNPPVPPTVSGPPVPPTVSNPPVPPRVSNPPAPTCNSPNTSCGIQCVNLQLDPMNCGRCANPCPPGNLCMAGACSPPMGTNTNCPVLGQTRCPSGTCTNVMTDPMNCGFCGNLCAPGKICAAGNCRTPM